MPPVAMAASSISAPESPVLSWGFGCWVLCRVLGFKVLGLRFLLILGNPALGTDARSLTT